jgi:hypothetical protein
MDVSASNDELETFIYTNLEAGTFQKNVLESWLRTHTQPFS